MRAPPPPIARRPRPGPWWIVAAALAATGASPPEVVKVRVPSAQVSNWFPPGSDLRVLPFDRFEALAKAARGRPPVPVAPRWLKARHSARWDAGRLLGRTELAVEVPPGDGAPLLVLEPWSPAVVGLRGGANRLRATPDGRLAWKVEPAGPSRVEFEWELRARPGSEGRAFALDLPGVDVSSLTLELPAALVPEATIGPRVGPEPGPSPGRSSWRFEAARGRVALRLRDPPEDDNRPDSPRLWLEGTTRVDLGASPINWRADWTLEESPGSPRNLTIGLDPGLEVVDVTGPRVASSRIEPGGAGSKVSIRLGGGASGPSPLTIRAICRAPVEGTWPVPSARPLDAIWTGGRTLVRLDAGRAFQSCVERSGRRVPPRPGDAAGPADLAFEPTGGAGPVADLTFRRPAADATVEVRGLLRLGDDVPRLEAAMTWSVEEGRLLAIAADLPPGWTPDGVVSLARQPVPWHADPLGNGGTRVHFGPPPADEGPRSITLTLAASARSAGVTGPLDLPRVRPTPGARLVDEVWVATPDLGLAIRPILGVGLAWLDPPDPQGDRIPTPWGAGDLEGALAWRWLAEGAEARIDRDPPHADRRGEVNLEATIRGARIALDWSIEVESPRGDLDPVPIHLDEPGGGPILWRSGEAGGPILEARPIDEARRASLGFPATGGAWDLRRPGPATGRFRLLGRAERSWAGRGRIPLLTLPARYRTRGTVAIAVEESTRLGVESSGLAAIEPSAVPGDPADSEDEATPPSDARLRKAATFGYGPAGGRLAIETTAPRFGTGGGLVREAVLVSHVSPGAGMRHRLTLGIAADSARRLSLAMPPGVAIDRLRRDGLAVAPIPSGDRFQVEIPAPAPGRPLCSLTIEYRTDDDPRSGPIEPSRLLPSCSLPCLGFAWEVVAPEPWEPAGAGRGLEATDPKPSPSVASRLLGLHWSAWGDSDLPRSAKADEAMLGDLDKAAADIADGETTLGDWALKLDAGRWPLVLDRLAIRSSGWGPGTRVDPAPVESRALGPVRSVLEPMGLVAVPLGGMILITAKGEVPGRQEDRDAWSAALGFVPSEDSGAGDRFQSASRWRGEATPRAVTSGEPTGRPEVGGRWRPWRFVSAGWPRPGASASLVDARADRGWGWFVASVVLVAGVLARGRSAKARGFGLAALGVVASVGLAWHWPGPSSSFSGLIGGGLGVLAFWLGRSLRPTVAPRSARPVEGSTTSRRGEFPAGLSRAPLLAMAMGLGVASAGEDADAPILALLPFDGPADPASKPDRVVLRVKDHERLERLARGDDPPTVAGASLVSASHRVGREEPGLAVVESVYEVEVDGNGPASWSLPVGRALELSAEVDGRPSPLAIAPEGLSATLTLEGPGTRRLRFRRLVPLSAIGRGGVVARVAINRAAFARVAVARGVGPSWVEVVGAAGGLASGAGGIEGGLGPLDALEVRWFPEDRPPDLGPQGPVEATFLWDARPAGDLIRMRLQHSDPEGLSALRVAMGPGLMVRRHSIPDVVSTRIEGTPDRPEWVARVDPPLPKDAAIEVDFWRPAPSGPGLRRWPAIDLPAAGKLSGLIGFRRPSDWSGRLEPRGGGEPASEAGFAKAWGGLPDDGLTLAGAARFGRSAALDVAIGPPASRRSIRTKVAVGLAPGRLDASIEGLLADRQGRSFALDAILPDDLRVVRVEAAGLLGWREVAPGRTRLQFDGSEAPERKIRIEAYLPAPADSAMSEARTYEAKVPWPTWVDAEPLPGSVEVSSPTRFQLEPAGGFAPLPTAGPVDPAGASYRSSFRVDRPSGLATVRWSAPAARVGVEVESELAIDPATLSWTAALTCDVSGGPADSLNLSLPTEWADAATLEVEGVAHRLVSQPIGPNGESTQWKILPDRPIWGRARLVIRSRRPHRPGREFGYPQVAPLAATGRGSVGRYDVAILNGSGRVLEVAGSSGLRPVDASRSRPVDSPSTFSRSVDRAYHVTGEKWSLRLKVGRAGDEATAAPEGREARVASAHLDCAIEGDGATSGRARYELEPRPGPFLALRLPPGAEIPWACVDGVVGPALVDAPGRWLIPLGDGRPRRVTLAWRSRPDGRPGPLVLPSPDRSDPPTLISVEAPDDLDLATPGGSLERLGRAAWEVEGLEQLVRRVVESLGDLDRSSPRDREAILEDLTDIELRVRHVARVPAGKDLPADPTAGRLQAALNSIAEAVQVSGLDDLIQEARARVGLARPVDDSAEGPATSSPEVIRLRRPGRSHFFKATGGAPARPPAIVRPDAASSRRASSAGSWAVVAIGILFWLALGGLVALGGRPRGRLATALVASTTLALLAWEPIGTLAALGLVGWGRSSE